TAAGHRREQASAANLRDHLDRLGGQRPPLRRPNQWDPLRSLLPLQPQWPRPARVAQSDQRAATEVGDQEADLAGTDGFRQRGGEHIDRCDRRRRLDRRKQRIQVQRRSPIFTHQTLNLTRPFANTESPSEQVRGLTKATRFRQLSASSDWRQSSVGGREWFAPAGEFKGNGEL